MWWCMGQLRLLLIITLAWFAFLFNIERIDVAGQQQINHELYRSRRFERPVSIVYCAIPKMPNEEDSRIITDFIRWRITRTFKQRYWQVQMAHAIASLTYKSDCIVEYGNDVVVCLP